MDFDTNYLSVYIEEEPFGEVEVCVAIVGHGVGKWEFWSDTGYEFNEVSDPDLVVQEALDSEGVVVKLPQHLIDKALEIACETYWERYSSDSL